LRQKKKKKKKKKKQRVERRDVQYLDQGALA
jgi:hypothetical protein